MDNRKLAQSLLAGVAGASTVTILNEVAKRTLPNAPRLDILGMRGLAAGARVVGTEPPRHLLPSALAADLAANTAYYSMVGAAGRSNPVALGAALGLVAGLGAVLLPDAVGLGKGPTQRSPQTAGMAMGWYLAAGLMAGLVYRSISRD